LASYPHRHLGKISGIIGGREELRWEYVLRRPSAPRALTALQAWIDYWAITGDDQYNNITTQAMLSNTGPENDYQPPRVYASLGNDDQAFWGIAALSAAERGFPDPPKDKPQWLALAQAVFNRQAERWDTQYCGGGLRWQVMSTNQGYNYKNAISNGLFFQIAARLARYTGNQTYTDWAEKVWDWTTTSGLLTQNYEFYDGYSITDCQATGQGKIQWSYNAGTYLAGAAYMYDNYVRFPFHLRSLFLFCFKSYPIGGLKRPMRDKRNPNPVLVHLRSLFPCNGRVAARVRVTDHDHSLEWSLGRVP
jgi:hypothetical protein